MKQSLLRLIILFLGTSNVSLGADANKHLLIEAKFIHYMNSYWDMSIDEYGEAGGARITYKAKPLNIYRNGQIVRPVFKRATLSREQVALIEQAVKEEGFFSTEKYLVNRIYALHKPDYRLKICFDEECHRVNLYDPKRIPEQHLADAEKFKTVWNLLWSLIKGLKFSKPELNF